MTVARSAERARDDGSGSTPGTRGNAATGARGARSRAPPTATVRKEPRGENVENQNPACVQQSRGSGQQQGRSAKEEQIARAWDRAEGGGGDEQRHGNDPDPGRRAGDRDRTDERRKQRERSHRGSSITIRQPCGSPSAAAIVPAVEVDDPSCDREPEAGAAVIARPRPRSARRSARTRARLRPGMPGPSSTTSTCGRPPFARASRSTRPAASAVLRSRAGSPTHLARARGRRRSARSAGATRLEHALRELGLLAPVVYDVLEQLDAGPRPARSGTVPDSRRERSSSCCTSRPSRSTWRSIVRRLRVGVARRRRRGSRGCACSAVIGVRSSWDDVGDEVAAHAVGLGELGGHLVERAASSPTSSRDVAVTRGRSRPLPSPGGGGHLPQRRRHAAGQELHHRRGEHAADEAA